MMPEDLFARGPIGRVLAKAPQALPGFPRGLRLSTGHHGKQLGDTGWAVSAGASLSACEARRAEIPRPHPTHPPTRSVPLAVARGLQAALCSAAICNPAPPNSAAISSQVGDTS